MIRILLRVDVHSEAEMSDDVESVVAELLSEVHFGALGSGGLDLAADEPDQGLRLRPEVLRRQL